MALEIAVGTIACALGRNELFHVEQEEMAMEKRLGRGLNTLLGTPVEPTSSTEVSVEDIDPNPFQPRKSMDASGLEELRDSIHAHGLLQPIVVRKVGDRYQLISGERRWRAARLAGKDRIAATIREVRSDEEMLELALVENVQRRDLDPMERARGFKSLMEALAITQEAVAMKVGLRRATVANHLRLLDLPAKVQDAVAKGLVSMGHARAMLGLTDPKGIEDLLEECVRRDLSVRDIERIVRERVQPSHGRAEPVNGSRPTWVGPIERRLESELGTRVRIEADESCHGQIRVEFAGQKELERLIERLAPIASVH
jgi:ParB family chromosome partitioning protein